ncbi:MAG: VCBS repeat-containing protein, partial [Candidatus Dormibacteraeota bacterium]|nr:VCBS repeat-containing protein [Candidatus Dormibacteraeota bacterium]
MLVLTLITRAPRLRVTSVVRTRRHREASVPRVTRGANRYGAAHARRVKKLALGATALLAVALMAILFGRAPAVAAPGTLNASWTRTLGTGAGSSGPSGWSMEPWAGATVGDLFGDGRKEVVIGNLDGGVWVLDAATGDVLPGWPQHTGGAIHSNPTIADLNNDGHEEVIATSEGGWVFVWNADGSLYPGWPQRPVPPGPAVTPGFSGGVAVGDLYGNGEKDLVVASWDQYLWAFGRFGNVLPGFPIHVWDTAGDTPTLVDLEHRGQLDIVVGFDSTGPPFDPYPQGGNMWAFRPTGCAADQYADQSGCVIPGFPVWMDETPWSSSAAGDLFNNGQNEIISGTGFNFGPPSGEYVMGLLENGWRYGGWPAHTKGQTMASPAIGDLLGNGGREVVDTDSYGNISVWDANGNLLPGWPVNPGAGQLHSNPTIGPINGTQNGIWLMTVPGLDAYDSAGHLVYRVRNLDWGGFAAPAIADIGNGQESVITLDQTNAGSNFWTVRAFPIPGTDRMLPGSWPTFHGNAQLSGQMAPTATISSLPSAEGQTSFPVSWSLDPGSPPATSYALWVNDLAAGRWTRYGSTTATSMTFSGSPGHTYNFTVVASSAWGSQDAGYSTNVATTEVWDQSGWTTPFKDMYAVDGAGHLFPGSSAPV